MTSVSRSEHDDETAEGTGAGASESTESRPARSTAAAKRPARTSAPKTTAATTAARSTAAKKSTSAAAAKTTAAKTAAAKTTAAKTAAAKKQAAAAAESAESVESAAGETAETRPASKRTAASRTASAKAAAARGEAAKTARTPRATAAKSAANTRTEAAATAASRRQSQQVAAALTTETTAAERPTRKAPATAAAAVSEPPVAPESRAVRSEIDEETVERAPKRPAVGAAAAASMVAVAGTEVAEAAVAEAPVATPVADAPVVSAPSPVTETSDAAVAASGSAAQAVAVIQPVKKPAARKKRSLRPARSAPPATAPKVLAIEGLVKKFGENTAVDGISLEVRAGSFFGIVGPNGAGKTTTLSMVTGLLRPDSGSVRIHDIDAWANPQAAKRATGVLPDRLRLFDRLTGAQLLYYSGVLRGLDSRTVRERSADLITAFGLDDAVDRLVADYSAGMTKKIALACAMIHSPRLLVLDEPFESVDPVSAANLTEILERYVAGGGTVVLSSHGMDLIERVCDSAAIIVAGRVLAAGTLDEVRAGQTLEDRFVELAGGRKAAEGMEWLHSFSD